MIIYTYFYCVIFLQDVSGLLGQTLRGVGSRHHKDSDLHGSSWSETSSFAIWRCSKNIRWLRHARCCVQPAQCAFMGWRESLWIETTCAIQRHFSMNVFNGEIGEPLIMTYMLSANFKIYWISHLFASFHDTMPENFRRYMWS